jgi:hypothetical protein
LGSNRDTQLQYAPPVINHPSATKMTKLYGIKNCDTMKKAMNRLAENGVA